MQKLFAAFVVLFLIESGFVLCADQDVKVTPMMKASTTISGQKIEYPKTDKAEMAAVIVEIQSGGESGRHMHPVPTYVHILEGTLTVEFEDGSRQTFEAGKAFLEVVNTWHNAKNLGDLPVKFLVVFAGEEGTPNLIRPEKHKTSARVN
jgi:quercetin dioxygenase-like cupin family protein